MIYTPIRNVLKENKDTIARKWTREFKSETNNKFSALFAETVDAFFAFIIDDGVAGIDTFLRKLAQAGFRLRIPVSDALKSFEMFRSFVMALFVTNLESETAIIAVDRLNVCLGYIMQTYSGYDEQLRTGSPAYDKEHGGDAAKREQPGESEIIFRDLSEKATVGIYLIQDDVFQYVNRRFGQIAGYSVDEMTRKIGPKDIVFHEDWPIVDENIRRRLSGEIDCTYSEFRLIAKNGQIRNVEVYSAQTTYMGRTAVIGTLIDASERKAYRNALEISEQKYRGLFEKLPDGFTLVTMDKKFIDINPAFMAMSGYSREELLNLKYPEITPKKWHARQDKMIEGQVLSRGYSDVFEKEYIRKDGTVFPIEVRTHLDRDEKGNPLRMWGFVRDISRRKEAEKALKKEELKYKILFESSNDSILLMKDDSCIDCNTKTAEMFGRTKKQMIGQKLFMFSPRLQSDGSDSNQAASDKIQAAMNGRFQFFEWRYYHSEGTFFDAEVSLNCIEFEGEHLLQCIIRDITARKQFEEEARKKSKDLEDVNAALRFLLKQREKDREELEELVLQNVRELILPYVDKLKRCKLDPNPKSYLGVLETNLRNIISPFARKMTSIDIYFTPTELRVAHLIREGKTAKEIAQLLGVSESAINLHRQKLRNKLGLNNMKVNLSAYLITSFDS
ncbi:MAG: PAS domain S-box protein [Syntrophorhabdaceae bacterium]